MVEAFLSGMYALKDALIFLIGYDGMIELARSAAEVGVGLGSLMLYFSFSKSNKSKSKQVVDKVDKALNEYNKVS